jgi:hypothetical protein
MSVRHVRHAAVFLALALILYSTKPAAQAEVSVFFGNLHSHTALSDGSGTPAEAYARARDTAGLDFLAITEHNHAQAGDIANNHALYTGPGSLSLIPTANSFTEEGRFIALYGQEFSTIGAGNHMNVIDAPRVIDVPNGNFRKLFEEWLPANLDTQGQEPLLLLNHPSISDSPADLEYGIDDFQGDTTAWLAAIDPRAELINLINGPSHSNGTHLPPGAPSERELRRYLNLGLHVAPTADQDNHKQNWGDATDARTAVLAPALTKSALLTAMKQRRVYATEDRNLRLVYRLNGELLGSRITGQNVPAAGAALPVTLAITDDDEPNASYVVDVFSDQMGGEDVAEIVRMQSVTGNGTHTISGVTYQGGAQYVYLRVRQADGNRAWTAPVWLEPAAAPPGGGPGGGEGPEIGVSLAVDERAETARITNTGSQIVGLSGWKLVSMQGNQVFDQFPDDFTLNPGESVTVTSGPAARTGAGFLRWTDQNIWNNSGDPGKLIDDDGKVVAESGR